MYFCGFEPLVLVQTTIFGNYKCTFVQLCNVVTVDLMELLASTQCQEKGLVADCTMS